MTVTRFRQSAFIVKKILVISKRSIYSFATSYI